MKFNKIKGISKKTNKEYYMIILDPNSKENKDIRWFEYKDIIKKYGGKWNPYKKFYYWFYYPDTLKDVVDKKIHPLIREIGKLENKADNEIENVLDFLLNLDGIIDDLEKIPDKKPTLQKVGNVKEALENFKLKLMNIKDDETFKNIMLKLVKLRDLEGRKYSPYNALLILFQDPKATWVKSKSDWEVYNRKVKDDAQGIVLVRFAGSKPISKKDPRYDEIIRPYLKKYKVKYFKDLPPGVKTSGLKDKLFVTTNINKFDYYYAYDVRFTEQIPGKEDFYKEYLENKPEWYGTAGKDERAKYIFDAIVKFLDEVGIELVFKTRAEMGGAAARSFGGKIEIEETDGTNVDIVLALLHELAHEFLHQTYLKEKNPDYVKFYLGKLSKDAKEKQAESVAWIVMEVFGFDVVRESSLSYNIMWGNTSDGMLKTFDVIRDVVNHIIDIINDRLSINESVGGISKAHHITDDDVAKFLGVEREYEEAKNDENDNEIEENNDFRKRREMNGTQTAVKSTSISYTAIILNKNSRKKLLNLIGDLIPEGWDIIAHHITINLGEAPLELKDYLDVVVRFTLKEFGVSDKAIAVSVEFFNNEIKSKNEKPHITIAVNRSIGGKPYDSNKITKWYKIDKKIILSGRLEEVPFNK